MQILTNGGKEPSGTVSDLTTFLRDRIYARGVYKCLYRLVAL